MDRDFKGIWIPKEIYLNDDLSWIEKILLVEIDSLSNINGCFASNDHFAKHLKISKDRVSRIISKLVKLGYITSEIIYKPNSKQIEKRVLYSNLSYSYKVHQEGVGENTDRGIGENTEGGIGENTKDNNTIYKNTNINKKESKKKKSEIDELIENYTNNYELIEAIEDFIKMRKSIKAPLTTRALKNILTKLDKLASNDSDKIKILDQSINNSWRGIFELKDKPIDNKPKYKSNW